jgi:mannosyltransferase
MTDSAISEVRGQRRGIDVAIALLLLALGLWLRLAGLGRDSYWLDEIYSVSFANLSALGTVIAVFLFDVHPPLYYLQLNAWGLFGHGDTWLSLNSVAWSVATLLVVFFGSKHRFGPTAGLFALGFCAVMGSEVYFANEVRMYAMFSCLGVLSWIAADRLRADFSFRAAIPLIVLLALLGATHSASIIAASGALLYAVPAGNFQQLRRLLPTWIGIAAVVGCAYLPWVINAGVRHIDHATTASIQRAGQTVGGWVLGYGAAVAAPWARPAAAVLVVLGLAAAALTLPRLWRVIACFIAWPLLFAALLSVAVQPIWLDRTFAFCAPFVAIAFGAAAGHFFDQRGRTVNQGLVYAGTGLIAAAIAASALLAYVQLRTPYKPDPYREVARYLDQQTRPGEIIYAPEGATFWGVSRYLIGPDWGSMLKVQDAEQLDKLKKWRRIYSLLGPQVLERLGLLPQTRRLDAFKIPVFTGSSPLPDLQGVKAIWLITTEDVPPSELPLCSERYPDASVFGRLYVYRVPCGP